MSTPPTDTLDAPPAAPAKAGPTETERFFFDTMGYMVLENFLAPDHVTRLLAAIDRAIVRRRRLVELDQEQARFTLINGKKSTRLLYLLEDDPLFVEMVDWAPLMPYVKALINPDPHHHASDAIVEYGSDLMARKGGWHIDGNDNGYRGLGWPIPLLQLKVGYYLTDMTRPGNGNLALVPGSHKSVVPPAAEDLQRRELFPGAVQVCAPAGSVILFHNAIWHTSAPFASPEHHRTILYYAYEHPWMIGSEEHCRYSKEFYNQSLTRAQRRFFHGFLFDPPEHRQAWG